MKQPEHVYEVFVGNIGCIYKGPMLQFALTDYYHYVEQSKANAGRGGGEPVTLMKDGDIYKEYTPRGYEP